MIFETDFMKLYEELSKINSSEDNKAFFTSLLDELSEFDYAFIDADGEELDDEEAMNAVVQSPDQLEDLGKGVCTDFVEYTRAKLDDRKIPYEVYYIVCTDKDGDRPSHVFVVVENKGKFMWLEAAWHSEAGIHEYDYLEELFEDIARKHCIYDGENYLKSCEIREIKKSLVGMSQEAIYNYVDTLPITWKAVEEGITESLKQIDYLPVSDIELFKEYANDILDGYGNMSDADIKSSIKEIYFEGKLAGYIGFSEYEENGSKCLGIGNFMIIERGKGLGSAVIQDIVEKYKNKYDLIYCFVDAKNDGAIRLYKKLGKVYDEDGPNDNDEYYVTFWDNGKWELDEGLSRLNESKADAQKLIDFAGEDLANRFLAVKNKLKAPENDLYYWIKNKTPEELQTKLTEVETTITKSRQRKHAAQGAELVAENDYWKVYLITTPEAAKIYGKDTRWCISMRDNTMFWEKYRCCDIYVFITKEFYDPNGKCSKLTLVHGPEEDEYDIFNQRDERLDRLPNCPIIPGVLGDSWLSGAKYCIELDEGQYISKDAPFDDFESELFTEPYAWLTSDYNKKLTFESYDEAYEFWYNFVLENILTEDSGYTISDSIGLTSEQD